MLKGLFLFVNSLVVSLPSSKTLSLNWNFGSMLGFVLVFQLFTGTFLVFYYSADSSLAFNSVQYIMYESNFGWILRIFHFNGASLFFFFLYLHFFKGLFFNSYRLKMVWVSGLTIFLLLMMEAFMGYVLVWAQMSFWASVVITSLLSVIPVYGPKLVSWIWGGFSVSGATLKFFFVLHFLLPWALILIIIAHLLFLHDSGSTSKLFCHGDYDKIMFYSFYWWKDGYNFIVWFLFLFFCFVYPFILGDPEMFIEADPMMSPVHIVPEWYFLFAYAILRAIPNKILGVLALLLSILFFYFFYFLTSNLTFLDKLFKIFNFFFLFISIILSWLGQCLVEVPFLFLSGLFSFFYFFVIFLLFFLYWFMGLLFSYYNYYN
uniref:cytochrome b n=1 Tax=Aphelenchoides medicagus TaxID=2306573 RepID=UPI001F13588E|nr:cytochrome b [Aphelenchoides medicagus]UKS08883.1 cytochrome b [Aphelenchoides medicagus]